MGKIIKKVNFIIAKKVTLKKLKYIEKIEGENQVWFE